MIARYMRAQISLPIRWPEMQSGVSEVQVDGFDMGTKTIDR